MRIGQLTLSFLWIIFFLCPVNAAQFPHFNFKHYTVEDGLSVNTVTSITQDSKGFMWFGTSLGLNCYDGKTFKHYIPTDVNDPGKRLTSILCVQEGAEGELLVGTAFGLYYFNPKQETFHRATQQTGDGISITSPVYGICLDAGNNLWIATAEQGLFHYNYDSKSLTQLTYNPKDPNTIPSNIIRNIYIDLRGRIWILSFDNGMGCYDPRTGICKRYQDYGTTPIERYDVMYEDKNNQLWLGNYSKGLAKLNLQTGEFTHFLTPETEGFINHVRSIIEYKPGVLLLASDDGLTFFDTKTCQYHTVKSNPSNSSGINDDYVHSLFIDKEGGLWIGTYFGGINYSSPAAKNFEHYNPSIGENYFPGKIVGVMTEDETGNLWIGTDDAGVIFFDRQKNSFRQYLPQKGRNSLSYQNIHALLCDKDKLWIGTYSGGLDCLNLKTGQFTNYTHNEKQQSLLHSSVYALYKDKQEVIWVGSPAGACTYDPQKDTFIPVPEVGAADISCIQEDEHGYLWLASNNNGLYRYNTVNKEWRRYHYASKEGRTLPSDVITTLSLDARKHLWIGTDGNGIAWYNYDTEKFIPLDAPILESTPIHRIIDYGNHLWITTNKGLIRLQPKSLNYKVYNQSDGLQSIQFSPNSGLLSKDGMIYIGGINGFNRFYPDQLIENTVVPSVYITKLRLFNKDVHCGDETGILDQAISYKDELTFRHDQSVIALEFVSLSFFAPDKNQYAYKLEGFDKDWSYIQKEPIVSYTNLPAGEYTFRVIASNNDGLWNNAGASLIIKILPPWWLSPWAYTAYVLTIIITIFLTVRHFVRKTERRHQANIQRINAEKEKVIYDTKINFFTNVIHEIRTPLSLIIAPLEHVMRTNKRINDVRDELQIIHRNSNRLLSLVNQLMDFRKTEFEGISIKIAPLNISSHIRQLYERFVLTAGQKGVQLSLSLPCETYWVETDGEALTKIASNLFSNAIKFARDKVSVSITYQAEKEIMILQFDDNGKGVPPQERENIFKPFYQIKENQPSDGIGTGVGLSLLNTLVAQLQGTVSVNDSSLGGASFSVTLPLHKIEEREQEETPPQDLLFTSSAAGAGKERDTDTDENTAENENDTGISPKPQQTPNILLVDDNNDMLSFLSRQLQNDYIITTRSNAKDALSWFDDHKVDLLVSDVMMPDIDGFELCKRIKDNVHTSHIPVILLTAKANVEAKIEGLECGADAYIEKPFSIDHLKAQIHSLLLNRYKIQEKFTTQPTTTSVASLATNKADAVFLQKVDEFIYNNISEVTFTSTDIASNIGMSRSTFFTKLRAISGLTPGDYIRIIRLKKAVEYFHNGETRINEVCYLVGFNSPSYFTKCFQQQFGEIPTAYIKKLQEE